MKTRTRIILVGCLLLVIWASVIIIYTRHVRHIRDVHIGDVDYTHDVEGPRTMSELKAVNPSRHKYYKTIASPDISSDAKLNAVILYWGLGVAEDVSSCSRFIGDDLEYLTGDGVLIIKYVPQAIHKIKWSVDGLRLVGHSLDDDQSMHSTLSPPSLAPYMRELGLEDVTRRQYAIRLIRELTGIEFQNRKEFDTWLEANKSCLQWDSDVGVFKTQPGTVQ